MAADEIIDFISDKMSLQDLKEALHQDRGGQRNWFERDIRQTHADSPRSAALPNRTC